MNGPGWDHDDRLLIDLGTAVDGFTSSAIAAFRLGRAGGATALAELVFDSACDPAPAGATRTSGAPRLLSFHAEGVGVDVELGDAELLGQVYPGSGGPAPAGSVAVESAGAVSASVALDEVGGFALPLPPPGPVRLRVHLTGRTVVTSWLVLRYG
jgi:hypothetical protein